MIVDYPSCGLLSLPSADVVSWVMEKRTVADLFFMLHRYYLSVHTASLGCRPCDTRLYGEEGIMRSLRWKGRDWKNKYVRDVKYVLSACKSI